jgi:hypothetical protein
MLLKVISKGITAVVVVSVSYDLYVVHNGFGSFAEDYTWYDNWILLRDIPTQDIKHRLKSTSAQRPYRLGKASLTCGTRDRNQFPQSTA